MKRLFFVLALLLPTACLARVPYQVGHTDTVEFMFNTLDASGEPVTLGGTSPAIVIYEEGSTTPISGGATLTIDYASTTGLHHVQLVCTTGNGYDVNKFYTVVIGGTTATADSVNVKGRELGTFQCVKLVNVDDDGAVSSAPKDGSIDADTLADNTITAAKIQDGAFTAAKWVDVAEPSGVPGATLNPMEMIAWEYFYGPIGINKKTTNLSGGEGEEQYFNQAGTKQFERDISKAGNDTTKDEVRISD